MGTATDAGRQKARIEDVAAVPSIRDAVINNQTAHDVSCIVLSFGPIIDDLARYPQITATAFDAILRAGTIRAGMADQPLWALVTPPGHALPGHARRCGAGAVSAAAAR